MSVNSPFNNLFNKRNLAFLFITGFLVVVAFFFIIKQWCHADRQLTAAAQAPVMRLEVVPVVQTTLFREVRLPAEIEAYQDILIYPKVPGFIKWIGIDRGSVVKKDELMITMYAPEYLARRNEGLARVAGAKAALAAEQSKLQDIQAELKKSQANLLADQSTYERVRSAALVPGIIAVNDVVQWAQTVQVDRQDVNALVKRVNAKNHEVSIREEELEAERKAYDDVAAFSSYLEIRAPFNGYITERRMHVGSFVGPDGTGAFPAICRMKQLDLLRITVPVPEEDTAGVIAGSQIKFSVSSFPGRKFVGTIARIANDLHKPTRTMPVELNYFNPHFTILPGMFCEVYWPVHRRSLSMFLPITAVVTTPLDSFVCKITNGVVKWVTVTKGQIMNNNVEVFGELKTGDLVAKEASEQLQQGLHVIAVPTNLLHRRS